MGDNLLSTLQEIGMVAREHPVGTQQKVKEEVGPKEIWFLTKGISLLQKPAELEKAGLAKTQFVLQYKAFLACLRAALKPIVDTVATAPVEKTTTPDLSTSQ